MAVYLAFTDFDFLDCHQMDAEEIREEYGCSKIVLAEFTPQLQTQAWFEFMFQARLYTLFSTLD